jgi:hypothetical protein
MKLLQSSVPTPFEITNGEDTEKINFYPVSMAKLLTLRELAQDVSGSVLDAMSYRPEALAGSEQHTEFHANGELKNQIVKRLDASLKVVESAGIKRKAGVGNLLDTVMKPENFSTICGLLRDSMRDTEITTAEIKDAGADMFAQLMCGWLNANRKVLDPFMSLLESLRPAKTEAEQEAEAPEEKVSKG